MFKLSFALLVLAAAALAYEHHGFVSEVKHIPYKFYGGGIGGGQGGFEGGIGGGLGGGIESGKDYYAYPKYKFEYGPDGSVRIVKYHADAKNGFEAVVKNIKGGLQQESGSIGGGQGGFSGAPKMQKIVLVSLALVGVALALSYEHHGFVSEVKHIPYKYYGGGSEGGQVGILWRNNS
uniref:Uncharacterized protein n=1 Tax=Anopheles dirus TaxID=7168 RepID=A0A182NIL1_9DIPT